MDQHHFIPAHRKHLGIEAFVGFYFTDAVGNGVYDYCYRHGDYEIDYTQKNILGECLFESLTCRVIARVIRR
jgi:hypothetical protein